MTGTETTADRGPHAPPRAPDRRASLDRLVELLREPVDIASLVAFRVIFGLMMLVSVVRFWQRGWIEELYIQPAYHFTYWGFEWVRVWPAWGMYVHFAALAVLALCVALGLFYRPSIILFFIGFTYVELIDKATYLNHYYLISVLSFVMIFLPLHRGWSIDALISGRRRADLRAGWAPRWCLWTVRTQIGLVYFFAGVAKLKGDWLWDARPLSIWLATHTDVPVLGPLLAEPWVAYAASWFGAAFDLTIVAWLLWPRTRVVAFAVVVAFHVATAELFYLGMFPWIMIGNALIFFSPSWPRRWLPGLPPANQAGQAAQAAQAVRVAWPRRLAPRLGLGLLGLHLLVQTLLPLRHHLYPGDVCWTEEGFRYAWHVMLVEKVGRVVYNVTDPLTARTWLVYPREYLTPMQEKQMSFQPDMILALAHHIARDFAGRGVPAAQVRAEAYVSWNGRPSRLLLDPAADLAAARDGLAPQPWISRAPGGGR
jgi:vitamin K-dependent gamma-carboxylase